MLHFHTPLTHFHKFSHMFTCNFTFSYLFTSSQICNFSHNFTSSHHFTHFPTFSHIVIHFHTCIFICIHILSPFFHIFSHVHTPIHISNCYTLSHLIHTFKIPFPQFHTFCHIFQPVIYFFNVFLSILVSGRAKAKGWVTKGTEKEGGGIQ